MISIILNENGTWPNEENEDEKNLSKKIGKQVENSENDQKIIKKLNEEKKWFTIRQLTSGLQIEAKQYVGTLNFPKLGFTLNIIPKIFDKNDENVWKNTTAIIDFTNGIKPKNIEETQRIYFEKDNEPILFDHVCRQLVEECEILLRRGLLRSYVIHAENTRSLRGKLLLQQQIINDAMCKPQFFSEFDELEYNNLENQIILEALTIAEKFIQDNELKMKTLRLAQQFSGLIEKKSTSKYERVKLMQNYSRQNDHYKNVHKICDLIIDNSGISDIYHQYSFVMPFFVDMNKTFERFIERLFEDYYKKENYEKILRQKIEKAWEIPDEADKKMKPDIIIKKNNVITTIIDVKYKPKLAESDLYQLGFYMHEFQTKNENKRTLDEAFAILPNYGENNDEKSFSANISKKTIYQKRIDVNDVLKKIRKGDPDLENIVEKLLEINI